MNAEQQQALESEILKAELKILIARAHNAGHRFEEHVEDCYICDGADNNWEEDLCDFGNHFLEAEIEAWNYVYTHPLWED